MFAARPSLTTQRVLLSGLPHGGSLIPALSCSAVNLSCFCPARRETVLPFP